MSELLRARVRACVRRRACVCVCVSFVACYYWITTRVNGLWRQMVMCRTHKPAKIRVTNRNGISQFTRPYCRISPFIIREIKRDAIRQTANVNLPFNL